MEKVVDIAKYLSKEYSSEKKEYIDEMKLHKMAFFIQKESFSKYGEAMFEEDFEGWKLGPVCREIRKNFEEIKRFKGEIFLEKEDKETIDDIFKKYKDMDSYRLSYVTHLQYSWIKSRIGIENGQNGNVIIPKEDIFLDAREQNERTSLSIDVNEE